MTKPRFVVDTDDKLKLKVMLKAIKEGKTITSVVLDYLKKWVKK